jgi:hypothetical protein
MTSTSMSQMVLLVFVTACGIPLVLTVQHFRSEPPSDNNAATAASAASKPASGGRARMAQSAALPLTFGFRP